MSKRKYFGTDGIRGTVGEFPITPEFVLKLGWALGQCWVIKEKLSLVKTLEFQVICLNQYFKLA